MAITEEDLTRERIMDLAKLHPVIAHHCALWEMKRLTWEQAIYGIILALIERNTSLTKDLLALRTISSTSSLTQVFHLNEIPDDILSQVANLPSSPILDWPKNS